MKADSNYIFRPGTYQPSILGKNIEELLTIVIPVRFRQCTLPRALEYYKDFPGRIIVADASPEPYLNIDKWATTFPHAEYHFSPNTPWMKIMVEVLQTVDTKYVVKSCDDDFIFLPGLAPSLKFLEENPDYVTVCGQEVALYDKYIGYETLEYILESKHLDSYSDCPSERIKYMWTYFLCKIHSIARTKAQLKIYEMMVEKPDLFAIKFFDKVWGYMMAAMGNFNVLPIVSHIRSREELTLPTSADSETETKKQLYDMIQKETKSDLSFERDFLNRDLSPLLEMVDEKESFLHELHQNLCSEEKKIIEYNKILEKYDLLAENSAVLDDKGLLYLSGGHMINNYPLVPRLGPGGSYDYVSKFRHNKRYGGYKKQDLYPVFKEKNIRELVKIINIVEKYPLEPWG